MMTYVDVGFAIFYSTLARRLALWSAIVVSGLFIADLAQELSFRFQSWCKGAQVAPLCHKSPLGLSGFVDSMIHQRNRQMNKWIQKQFRKMRTMTFSMQALDSYHIFTVDPENIKAILVTQFKDFNVGLRHEQIGPLLGNGIFAVDGKLWSHSRAILRPAFMAELVNDLAQFEPFTEKLLQVFENLSRTPVSDDGLFNAQDYLFKFTMDFSTHKFFGASSGFLSQDKKADSTFERFSAAFDRCQDMLFLRTLAGEFYNLVNSSQFRQDIKFCRSFVSHFVERYLSQKEQRYTKCKSEMNYLARLAEETRDPDMLRDQAMNLLLAGRDTTAGTLGWALYLLARHPKQYQALRAEVLETCGKTPETLSFENLSRCTEITNTVKETLRLFPTAPNSFRYAAVETSLPRGGGKDGQQPIYISKGRRIFYSIYTLHRHVEIWGPDAESFRPSRFNEPIATGAFMPFSRGPRSCIGQNLAMLQARYVLARIVQRFKSISTSSKRMEAIPAEHFNISMCAANGVWVRFES